MKTRWVIRLRFVKAIDKNGNTLPYRSRVKRDFDNYGAYKDHINTIKSYVKKRYGEETTLDVIKVVRTLRTRGTKKE